MRFRIRDSVLGIAAILFIFLGACHSGSNSSNSEKADIKIQRFERDLFSVSVYDLLDSIPSLSKNYPEFFPLFCVKVIEIGKPEGPNFAANFMAFTTDFTIYRVSQRVEEIFPDLSSYETALGDAFGRYHSFFPDHPVPDVLSCISGFNQSIITTDSLLVIGLDKYLGSEDEFYKLLHPPVPEFMREVMRPEKIVPDALQAWLITEFPFYDAKDNLVANMIYKGRLIYAVKQMLPELPDTLLWGFSPEQLNFCEEHEKRMWEYLVENKKLFDTDGFIINQFVGEAPFTKDFSQESPGRASVWQGYQIVDSYMRHNKEVSLLELMQETNYQKILNLSKYNP